MTDDNFHRLQYINFLYDFPASINKFVEKDRQTDEVGKMCYAANRTILHRLYIMKLRGTPLGWLRRCAIQIDVYLLIYLPYKVKFSGITT